MATPILKSSGELREALRVFISYSHQDRGLVEQVERVLRANGLDTLWDQNFEFGHGFPEQIKNFIAHAHVFRQGALFFHEFSLTRGHACVPLISSPLLPRSENLS